MNQEAQKSQKETTNQSKNREQETTGYLSPGQLAMENDLGLGPDANLPAPAKDRQPRPHPDNSACSSMEHEKGPHASHR